MKYYKKLIITFVVNLVILLCSTYLIGEYEKYGFWLGFITAWIDSAILFLISEGTE